MTPTVCFDEADLSRKVKVINLCALCNVLKEGEREWVATDQSLDPEPAEVSNL